MATPTHKRLALSIIDFLSTSLRDSTLQPEDADSIEIAQNCIAECFHVDPSDTTSMKEAVGQQNLLSIYGVYEKMKTQNTKPTTTPPGSSSSGAAASLPKKGETGGPTDASERLKGNGNTAMQRKDYKGAIALYTDALQIAPLNPIYLSNRAAAYSANNQHDLARNDAELATATDPKYTKAWSRLGLSCFALGDAKAAMEAYQKGIEAEGNGGSEAMKKGYETAKRKVEESSHTPNAELDDSDDEDDETARSGAPGGGSGMPDLSALAGMMGGNSGGGMPDLSALAGMMGGGGRGMPDLGALMQNPMMRQMAQGLMSNPEMMSGLMNNPQLRNMMGGGGGAPAAGGDAGGAGGAGAGRGGMPDIGALLQNPAIADMARQFMGGAGGAGGGAGGAGGAGAGRGAGGQ
ncbi:Small glutamine-rich tetratricopeptide repeat-containing protein 2 [Elasticomyces elasticus]|nr:Small glutamine-rich tetratricopeptide repeat-containing protein 2 [Elasticomyces elasticus]